MSVLKIKDPNTQEWLPAAIGVPGATGYVGSIGYTGSIGTGYTGSTGYAGSFGYTGSQAAVTLARSIMYYIGDDPLVIGDNIIEFITTIPLTVTNVSMKVRTAPTGANLIIDIHVNDVTIFTTQANRPTITAGNTSSTSGTPDITTIASGSTVSICIDQVGSTVKGAKLSTTLNCEVTQ